MNKTKKGALGAAGVGVVALAMFGGGTFAYWSDYDTIKDNEVGAGKLELNVDHKGAATLFEPGNLAPGENKFRDVYIASNNGDSVPDGELYVTLQNIRDHEDKCTNTNGEKAADSDCSWNSVGDLSKEAVVKVVSYKPLDKPLDDGEWCRWDASIERQTNPVATGSTLFDIADDELRVDVTPLLPGEGALEPGQGICVRVDVSLPMTASNAVQGDSTKFDAYFELVQPHIG